MSNLDPQAVHRLLLRAAIIGVAASALLNLLILFVPMPDVLTEGIIYLQMIGLWIELRRAAPYQMSTLYPFLINAAVYALLALSFLLVRRHRRAALSMI